MARNVLFLTLITLLCLSFQVSAQRVSGRITGGNGDGLAFATIHQKGTTSGSTSNPDGYFSLMLPAGSHTLVFQFVGYKTQEVAVTVDEDPITLQVKMEPEVTQLQEVVINATDKDPAYAIIQNAIAKRKEHLREVSSYQCQVYVKGLQRLDIVPDKILGVKLNIDTGIVYLSESVSELSFQQPEKVKEKVISSKTSGDNRAFSYNQASDMLINFYQNQLYAEGLSERSFVSPIAQNALFFYNYKLAGVINENDRIINKIQVIPKRSSDPVFNGWIYILEDSWRIHSLELLLTKANQIEFVDSLTINQVFTPVDYQGNEVWMMLSQKFQFQLEAFGVKGGGYFVGVHSQYDLQPAFEKKYFNLERVKVEANSNKKDSLYWQRIRPIPLTQLEALDYRLKDSIQVIKETEHYQDSVDREGNQLTITNVLLTGKTFRKSFKKQSFYIPSMMELLQYNTVEGWVPNLRVVYTQRYEDRRFYRFIPQLRYGFSNRKFNPQLEARYYYNPKRFASGRISFGRSVEQFNQDGPVPPFANAYYTLLKEQNILKIFEKTFFKLGHNIELVNGLRLGSRVEFAERSPLENTTDFVLNDHEERSFTPNKPVNASLEDTDFKPIRPLPSISLCAGNRVRNILCGPIGSFYWTPRGRLLISITGRHYQIF